MLENGTTKFSLTPEFLNIIHELEIDIPFKNISAETYPNNLKSAIEGFSKVESESHPSKEAK